MTQSPARPPVSEPADHQKIILAVGALLIFAVAVVAVLLLLASGDSGGEAEVGQAVEDPATSSSIVETSTTEGATTTTTTAASSSTTTSSTTTTSTSSTSTTTTTTTSSTTTVPVPVGTPGPVTLVETGLVLDTGSVLRIGSGAEGVLADLEAVLGAPDSDTGFSEVEFCFSGRSRFVRWGQLEVVLGENEGGGATFTQWYVDGSRDPTGLVTVDGLGVGATVGFLEVNYGSALTLVPAFEGAEAGVFAVTNSGNGGTVLGVTSSLEPEAVVTEMWAGDECTRVFT